MTASAETIRALVPYPSGVVVSWQRAGPLVVTGATLLWVDGWLIVDVVHTDELLGLDALRAVRFDELQERFGRALFQLDQHQQA